MNINDSNLDKGNGMSFALLNPGADFHDWKQEFFAVNISTKV